MVKCVRIKKTEANKILSQLVKFSDHNYKITRDEEYVYIPISEEFVPQVLDKGYEIIERESPLVSEKKDITNILAGIKGNFSVDRIGDIAIIETDIDLAGREKEIAEALKVRSIFLRSGITSGIHRVRPVTLLWGEDNPITVHTENGCQFIVDVVNCFFNSRNSQERARVAMQVQPCERVVDMFAGVGTFAIQIARRCAYVEAVDINPTAVELMYKNIYKNKVAGRVLPHEGDIYEVAPVIGRHMADRIIMDYPERALEFLDVAAYLAKRKVVLHIYLFAKSHDEAIEKISNALIQNWFEPLNFECGVKREIAPHRYYIGIDVVAKLTHSE
ncbi:MAG: methyltransferase [Candidatus Korarchaeota archaeon]